ncbi:hypothetical protein CEUSTIGMA_g10849.t1 [Chlamydomonas eustigma]|uniref:Uncharacterized protein n=1 Tax=Chlamydomonas eustigma TaxID=1157962 RepID=A0A250XK27_9CHLO|nr:hypothetical protein CEUSTIGMA_g10849.t1 [Chlamydomonas eustigma]|eukprot:GAX83424.1 hypothetical protein CEUSTIGMA_g10849.t1 [Chlamydomonas eustigma]
MAILLIHILLVSVVTYSHNTRATYASHQTEKGENVSFAQQLRVDLATLSSKLLDGPRQWERGKRLASEFNVVARGMIAALARPYYKAAHKSWASFNERLTKVIEHSSFLYESLRAEALNHHQMLLQNLGSVVNETPYLQKLSNDNGNKCSLVLLPDHANMD